MSSLLPAPAPAFKVGMETFRLCRELVDGIVLVDNSATSAAIKDVFNETRWAWPGARFRVNGLGFI